MSELNEKKITITDENGKEVDCEILFTYEDEETGNNYVFFSDNKNSDEVIVMRYTEDNELLDIEDDEEYNHLNDVFESYLDEIEKEDK